MRTILSLLFCVLVVSGCASARKKKVPPPPPLEPMWSRFQRIKGDWLEAERGQLHESWMENGQFTLKGEGYTLDEAGNRRTNDHTRFMFASDSTIAMERRTISKNVATSARYKMIRDSAYVFGFKNNADAWPQQIIYELKLPDTLLITQSNGSGKVLTSKYLRYK
jgi:hypothetical protein